MPLTALRPNRQPPVLHRLDRRETREPTPGTSASILHPRDTSVAAGYLASWCDSYPDIAHLADRGSRSAGSPAVRSVQQRALLPQRTGRLRLECRCGRDASVRSSTRLGVAHGTRVVPTCLSRGQAGQSPVAGAGPENRQEHNASRSARAGPIGGRGAPRCPRDARLRG